MEIKEIQNILSDIVDNVESRDEFNQLFKKCRETEDEDFHYALLNLWEFMEQKRFVPQNIREYDHFYLVGMLEEVAKKMNEPLAIRFAFLMTGENFIITTSMEQAMYARILTEYLWCYREWMLEIVSEFVEDGLSDPIYQPYFEEGMQPGYVITEFFKLLAPALFKYMEEYPEDKIQGVNEEVIDYLKSLTERTSPLPLLPKFCTFCRWLHESIAKCS
ncbi:MAG: hypothetical protein J1E99_06310 [Muribaculaceae bacterium]|nr:hypothetical protein [Muribaculaceae bacterium]